MPNHFTCRPTRVDLFGFGPGGGEREGVALMMMPFSVCVCQCVCVSRGLGRRIHGSVEDTKLSNNTINNTLSLDDDAF